jgi:Flp pilus assembly protein TadG
MRIPVRHQTRRGSVLPLVAICLPAFIALCALAIDLSLVALARDQAQNVADTAAMTGLRQLNGDASNNYNISQASVQANNVFNSNSVLAQSLNGNGSLSFATGAYYYDDTNKVFVAAAPAPSGVTGNTLAQATVTASRPSFFAKIFGVSTLSVSASATAVHRPRDLSLVLDFSGSMNNESDIYTANESYLGNIANSPNNADPLVPQFGHYSATSGNFTYSGGNAAYNTSLLVATDPTISGNDTRVGRSNVTVAAVGTPAQVNDYFQDASSVSYPLSTPAFTSMPSSYQTNPLGDIPLRTGGMVSTTYPGTAFAANVTQVITGTNAISSTNWETKGYDNCYGSATYDPTNVRPKSGSTSPFKGYTVGPAYWGASFFIWPPDPRAPVGNIGDSNYVAGDWRRRFFFNGGNTTPAAGFADGITTNNTLWTTAGAWNAPSASATGYKINYKAILAWIKGVNSAAQAATGSPIFPPRLRAGRILFYDAIPDDVCTAAYTPTSRNYQIPWDTTGNAGNSQNQRFWKEYIDFALGVWRDPYGNMQAPGAPTCSYGTDFTWNNTVQISTGTNPVGQYMNYGDRPQFPRHRFWFGPMTMIQMFIDVGYLPGTAHDNSTFTMKIGLQAGFQDIQRNYPNSQASLAMFSRPHLSGEPYEAGQFSLPQVAMTNDYNALIQGLWYAPGTSANGPDIRLYDSTGEFVPRAHGDYASCTASAYGFVIAHNMLSSAVPARTAGAGGTPIGGYGRRGSDRLVIHETDGQYNVGCNYDSTVFIKTTESPPQSYYNIAFTNTNGNVSTLMTSGSSALNDALAIVDKLAALDTDTTIGPGFSRSAAPLVIHTLGFGVVFEPNGNATVQNSCVSFLQQVSTKGQTTFPSSSSDPTNGYKWIIGTQQQRTDRLRQAILNCMRSSGARIALIQ